MMDAIKIQLKSFNEGYQMLAANGDKRNKLWLFIDYLICALRYGSSASDYFDFEFYDKRHHVRKEFFCYKLKRKLFRTVQDYSKRDIYDNKIKFFEAFEPFIGREWLYTPDANLAAFEAFSKRHPVVIAKPYNASGGVGVRKLQLEGENLPVLFEQLKAENILLEEVISQHPTLNEIFDKSLNTLRIATVMVNGEMKILAAVFRCGSGNAATDNIGSGGMAVKVEPETGILISDARGHGKKRFIRHPDTGVMFHGFRIPNWDKVLSMLEKATRTVPGVGYTGWDVAVRENDAVLVEGNFEGMIHLLQRPANQGIRKDVEKILAQIKKADPKNKKMQERNVHG